MAKNPFVFPIKPTGDWVIIERIPIKTKHEIAAEKTNIVLPGASPAPKNIVEMERQRAEQLIKYEDIDDAWPKIYNEHPNQGIVMAVGKGRHLDQELYIPNELKPGDHVYFRGNGGEPIMVNKKVYRMIKEYDVFAIVKK